MEKILRKIFCMQAHAVMGFLESLSSPSPEILHQMKNGISNSFYLYSYALPNSSSEMGVEVRGLQRVYVKKGDKENGSLSPRL